MDGAVRPAGVCRPLGIEAGGEPIAGRFLAGQASLAAHGMLSGSVGLTTLDSLDEVTRLSSTRLPQGGDSPQARHLTPKMLSEQPACEQG